MKIIKDKKELIGVSFTFWHLSLPQGLLAIAPIV